MSGTDLNFARPALAAVMAAAREQGADLSKLYERACELLAEENSKILEIHPRDVEHAILEIAIAEAAAREFIKAQ